MSFFAKGSSITRPPLLNDTNYPYWNVRMRAFFKSQYLRAWKSIRSGWTPPTDKDKEGNTFQVSVDDPRFLSGELISVHKNKVVVKDKDGNSIQIDKDDPRFLSGELVHHIKGTVTVRDKDGNVVENGFHNYDVGPWSKAYPFTKGKPQED